MIDRQKLADAKDWAEGQRKGAPNFHAVTLLDALAKAEAKNDRLREALTPSEATKQAYMGEFVFRFGEGQVHVPWVAIKEIMKAIMARALQEAGDDI